MVLILSVTLLGSESGKHVRTKDNIEVNFLASHLTIVGEKN